MPTFASVTFEGFGAAIFRSLGVPQPDAELVSGEVIRTHRMGLVSHGAIRILQYAADLRSGLAKPRPGFEVVSDSGATAVLDCDSGLGILAAYRALELAIGKANANGLGMVLTRRCNHVGRLGAYPEAAARRGYLCLAGATIPKVGHFVVPAGGTEGRLGTNPLAFAAPSSDQPIVGDFATSVIPEGRIRAAKNAGELIPEGAATDAAGMATRDPSAFYGPPMGGLLPFGGPVRHKGYALGLLIELLGGTLPGEAVEDNGRPINGLWLIVIDPGRFLPAGRFELLADDVVEYMRSSAPAPGVDRVRVPGDREFEALQDQHDRQEVAVDEGTWEQLVELARELKIMVPARVSD